MAVEASAEHVVECAGCHSTDTVWNNRNEQGVLFCLCRTCGCKFWDGLAS